MSVGLLLNFQPSFARDDYRDWTYKTPPSQSGSQRDKGEFKQHMTQCVVLSQGLFNTQVT